MTASKSNEYVVVARRYRPQSFDELVGQSVVSQALATAITTNRVGHAYLFTGARGVGKTSTARIFAKSLNCVRGPTPTPCNQCDICEGVSTGEDVDVLEIDGASNRGIDEIRQLRSNVNIRPSRARFKIYIIDEVHMLTLQAFNALLKTLEEPPEHVKFIFCTTDPEKIPITILSRCQRFDFPPVESASIADRLRYIVEREGVTAEPEALELLARRANGSMRDSQSLLEQLLSYCTEKVTVGDVHAMLGTARGGQLTSLAAEMLTGNVAGAFEQVDLAIKEGVDAGRLGEQLVAYFRDMIAAVAGCGPELMLSTTPADHDRLKELGSSAGLETLLAVVQLLDQAVTRMRQSVHVRTLLEVAVVRIANLERLDDLAELIAQVRQGGAIGGSVPAARPRATSTVSAPEKKTAAVNSRLAAEQPARESPGLESPGLALGEVPTEAAASLESGGAELAAEQVEAVWNTALAALGDMTADFARRAERLSLAGANRVVAHFRAGNSLHKEYCERPERRAKLEEALSRAAGRTIRLDLAFLPGDAPAEERPQPPPTTRQRMREKEQHPLVRKAAELFGAEVVRVEEARSGRATS